MMHLRKFKEQDIKQNLEDICLDLEDEGYTIEVNVGGVTEIRRKDRGPILINCKGFDDHSLKEVLDRIKRYMASEGYDASIHIAAYRIAIVSLKK